MNAFGLLISTILLRPYVFVLLGFYLIAGNDLMGRVLYFLNMVFILSVTFYIGEYIIGMINLSIFSILNLSNHTESPSCIFNAN